MPTWSFIISKAENKGGRIFLERANPSETSLTSFDETNALTDWTIRAGVVVYSIHTDSIIEARIMCTVVDTGFTVFTRII